MRELYVAVRMFLFRKPSMAVSMSLFLNADLTSTSVLKPWILILKRLYTVSVRSDRFSLRLSQKPSLKR
jgi:hypothetical protein